MVFDFNYWRKKSVKEYTESISYFDNSELKKDEISPVFENISQTIISRGYLKSEEFINICIWKTLRQKKRYINKKNLIKIPEISKKIIEINKINQSDCISQSISSLIVLDGVQVAVASAILTVLFPEKYCIIDYRVRRALFFIDNCQKGNLCFENYQSFSKALDSLGKDTSINDYIEYLNKITEKANKHNCTPREFEMALWKYDEQRGEK